MLKHARGVTVGDFGCASCIDYPMWVKNGYVYTGIDFTEKFIKYAEEQYHNIKIVNRDVSDTGLRDECFDTSYCKDLLEHQQPEKYLDILSEMWRLTKQVMMIGFYIAPTERQTEYRFVSDLFYKNHYNKQEVLNKLHLFNPESIKIIESIGYNSSALYVVMKHE